MVPSERTSGSKISNDSILTEKLVIQSIAKIDGAALGIAIGSVGGLGIFLITNLTILKEDVALTSSLSLLNQYFSGYSVSLAGSFVGFVYGLISGFICGWSTAFIRNSIIKFYLFSIKYKEQMISVNNFIDYP